MIKAEKAEFRKKINNILFLLSQEEKNKQSEIVSQKLFGLPIFQNSRKISIFLSIDNEIDTKPIIRKIFENEKLCFVPRYSRKTGMEMVQLHSMKDWETLSVTSWGIRQPHLTDKRVNALDTGLDLILVPGMAFTRMGHRLGHGQGYYDKFLKQILMIHNQITTIGLAFDQQIFQTIPFDENTDEKIDFILSSTVSS